MTHLWKDSAANALKTRHALARYKAFPAYMRNDCCKHNHTGQTTGVHYLRASQVSSPKVSRTISSMLNSLMPRPFVTSSAVCSTQRKHTYIHRTHSHKQFYGSVYHILICCSRALPQPDRICKRGDSRSVSGAGCCQVQALLIEQPLLST
eukprot:1154595-Pelagomonas_calceolata.AAC.4